VAIALAALIGLFSHANLPTTISLVIYAQEKKIIKNIEASKTAGIHVSCGCERILSDGLEF